MFWPPADPHVLFPPRCQRSTSHDRWVRYQSLIWGCLPTQRLPWKRQIRRICFGWCSHRLRCIPKKDDWSSTPGNQPYMTYIRSIQRIELDARYGGFWCCRPMWLQPVNSTALFWFIFDRVAIFVLTNCECRRRRKGVLEIYQNFLPLSASIPNSELAMFIYILVRRNSWGGPVNHLLASKKYQILSLWLLWVWKKT